MDDLDLSVFDEEITDELDTQSSQSETSDDIDLSGFDEVTIAPGEGSAPEDFSPVEDDKMGKLEAAAIGTSEGASLGLDRPLTGLTRASFSQDEDRIPYEDIASGIEMLVGDEDQGRRNIENKIKAEQLMAEHGITETKELPDLYKEYLAGRKEAAQRSEQAMEDQPAATLLGNVAGGFVSGGAISKTMGGAEKLARSKRLLDRAKQARLLEGKEGLSRALTYQVGKESAKQAAKESAVAGSILGGALSEGETTEDVAKDIVISGGAAALAGGTLDSLGGLTRGLINELAPGIRDAFDAYSRGKLTGKTIDKKEFRDELKDASIKFAKDFEDRLNNLGLTKEKIKDLSNKMGVTINSVDDLEIAESKIAGLEFEADRKAAQELLGTIREAMGKPKGLLKAEERMASSMAKEQMKNLTAEGRAKLQSKSAKRTLKNLDTPIESRETNIYTDDLDLDMPEREMLVRQDTIEVDTPYGPEKQKIREVQDVTPFEPEVMEDENVLGKTFKKYKDLSTGKVRAFEALNDAEMKLLKNPEELTIDQAEQLLANLNSKFSSISEGTQLPDQAKRAATDLAVELRKKINMAYDMAGEVDGQKLGDINRKFTQLLEAKKWAGVDDRLINDYDKRKHIQKMAKFIEGSSDTQAISDLDNFLDVLKDSDEAMYKQYQREIEDFRNLARIVGDNEALQSGSQYGAIFGALSQAANRLANMIGRVRHSVGKDVSKLRRPLGQAASKFVETSPENIQLLLRKSKEVAGGLNFSAQLEKAASANVSKRRAILFGLYSNPSFRKMFGLDRETEK